MLAFAVCSCVPDTWTLPFAGDEVPVTENVAALGHTLASDIVQDSVAITLDAARLLAIVADDGVTATGVGGGATQPTGCANGVPATQRSFAGRLFSTPLTLSTHGHGHPEVKNAGAEVRYSEFGRA
jgi:hypothetical protein